MLSVRDDQVLVDGKLVKFSVPAIPASGLISHTDLETPPSISGIVHTQRVVLSMNRVEEHRELCSSELFDLVACTGGMDLTQGLIWFDEMTTTIVQCHAHGLSHGQLQPEHVLLDARGSVKLIGFDPLCWRQLQRGASIGDTHALRPMLRFDAPELQGRSHATLAELYAADVWALGIVLAGIIAGEPPRMTSLGDVELPSQLQAAPVELSTLLSSMLCTAPGDRPSMMEVDEAVKAMLPPKRSFDSPQGIYTASLALVRTGSELSEMSDAPTRCAYHEDTPDPLVTGVAPSSLALDDDLYNKLRMLKARPGLQARDGQSIVPPARKQQL